MASDIKKYLEGEIELESPVAEDNYIELPKPFVYRIVQLFVTGQYTQKEIANIIGKHPNTVSKYLRHPDVVEMINRYQQEETMLVDQTIKGVRLKAAHKMAELLDADNEMVQWQSARDILDRTGHKADNKSTVNINVRSFEEKLGDLLDNIEDADFTEVKKD